MGIIENATSWMIGIANDNSHGYDQAHRWGPDYDCSSLVISAYKQAGVGLTCTYTGNMLADMTAKGFSNITAKINLATGADLQRGDVLLNTVNHTALYIGNGQVCEACGNERGGITGGQTGDQTGKEIRIGSYYNFPWNYVLRYNENDGSCAGTPNTTQDTYTVQAGDSLWSIAERFYGSGAQYPKLKTLNGLTSNNITVGQVLKLSGDSTTTTTTTTTTPTTKFNSLPTLRQNATGKAVSALQTLLKLRGYSLPTYGVDGDFGSETLSAVRAWQNKVGLTSNGVCDEKTWIALIQGE